MDHEKFSMELSQLLLRTPVLRIPGRGWLSRQARIAINRGEAIRPLPGILMSARVQSDPDAWIYANSLWRPSSVITGRAALRLHGMPGLAVPAVDVLLPYSFPDRGLLRFHCSPPPGSLIHHVQGVLVSTPAAAALFLGIREDWDPICAALFKGITRPEDIQAARDFLIRHRGAPEMDLTLRYISQMPWSVPELELHELLRKVGITGWRGNMPVLLHPTENGQARPRRCHPDAGFEAEKLAVEVNSQQYHSDSESFTANTLRARWFAAEGWTQMPVTPNQLRSRPNDFLADLCSRLHRRHRPPGIPRVRYRPRAPFWF